MNPWAHLKLFQSCVESYLHRKLNNVDPFIEVRSAAVLDPISTTVLSVQARPEILFTDQNHLSVVHAVFHFCVFIRELNSGACEIPISQTLLTSAYASVIDIKSLLFDQ